jgi:hypothetical protein
MSAPGVYSGGNLAEYGQNAIAQLDDAPELLPNAPTVASPFTPGAAAAGNNMFGSQVPGSFDRDMGDDMEVL